jgi:3-oxoacyl-[acyl-carrier-protein] synthase-3
VLLQRGHSANLLQETAFLIDPEMADEVYVPGGGTMYPFSPENLDTEIMYYHTPHPQIVSTYLSLRFAKRLIEVIRSAAGAGKPVDYLALRHLPPRDRKQEVGCHGTNDPLISLDLALKKERISDGARVVLASSGIGFSYAAAVIRWGR